MALLTSGRRSYTLVDVKYWEGRYEQALSRAHQLYQQGGSEPLALCAAAQQVEDTEVTRDWVRDRYLYGFPAVGNTPAIPGAQTPRKD